MSTCEFSDGRCCDVEKILRGSLPAALVARHGLEKIKTIGDCYTAAAGVPNPHPDHARKAALLAVDMRDVLATSAVAGQPGLELRIGINTGPVVTGVIGTKRSSTISAAP
jgi:adenylate cyclase